MAIPTTPAGSGSIIVAVTSPAGATNFTQLLYSQTDAQRIFAAWQNRTGNASGTVTQFTAWIAQFLQGQLVTYVTQNEQTAIVPPTITSANS